MSTGSLPAIGPEIFRFAQRCQTAADVWLSPPDPVARVCTAWKVLQSMPSVQASDEESALACIVSRLAARVAREIDALGEGRGPIRPHPAAAIVWMARHLAEPSADLRALATALGVSRWHLSRVISRETGHGFAEHLHGLRVLEAAHLLATTRLSVKEVAAAVGYPRTGELDRHFGRRLRMTPSRFRAGLEHAAFRVRH
ncbi:MAG TPA: AraC family transcriptional regulator [Vicinamibacterales bacterium]|nr:AraC family transcriptional regulator [Vicinamibacterales bacterium]